jgi:hypothetical protein
MGVLGWAARNSKSAREVRPLKRRMGEPSQTIQVAIGSWPSGHLVRLAGWPSQWARENLAGGNCQEPELATWSQTKL